MRYEEYKGTEHSWQPSIPKHWNYWRARRLFDNPKEKNANNEEKNILSLTLKGVIRNDKDNPIGLAPSDYATYQLFDAGELVFKLIDLENVSTSRVGIVPERGIMSSAYIRFKPRNELNIRYFYYQYNDWYQRQVFNGLGAGVRQTLSAQDLLSLKIIVPPREEQDQIVRYLDWKVSCINKLIHGYQRQIKLLEERRQTVIDRAALEGVDGAKLKDSGTHWVKRIPENWKMVYSKKLFAERKDKAFPEDEQLTASQKYGVISQKEFIEREGRRVTVVLTGSDILKHVGIGDFIISMRSFQGGLEYSYVEGKISSAYVMLIPRKKFVYDEYFKWLLKSKPYIKALQGTSDLVRDGQALRYANFAKVPLPQIPLDEQKRIAEYIEIETSKIDASIPVFEKQIELLKEYRTRLISDVVTGQKDVRNIEIPEFEVELDFEADTENETDEDDDTMNEEATTDE